MSRSKKILAFTLGAVVVGGMALQPGRNHLASSVLSGVSRDLLVPQRMDAHEPGESPAHQEAHVKSIVKKVLSVESAESLSAEARELGLSDGAFLEEMALNPKLPHRERFAALTLLVERFQDFLPSLERIALSRPDLLNADPAPHSIFYLKKNFEITLRIHAMAALEHAKTSPELFEKLESTHHQGVLRQMARIGRVGVERGEPLLEKYIDAKIASLMEGNPHAATSN